VKLNSRNYPIDLNADLGEGGQHDEALLQLITSANIACGGHTGDRQTMENTVKLAHHQSVNIGAHPSFPDREHFGRKAMTITDTALTDSLYEQISSLKGVCDAVGAKLFHVKPHGALYNQAAYSERLGHILINVIKKIDPNLSLMVLASSPLVQLAKHHGLTVIEEAFADRAYLTDGSLASRGQTGAVIEDAEQVLKQVEKLIKQQAITTLDGNDIVISANSICLHGDNQHALCFAKLIAKKLTKIN